MRNYEEIRIQKYLSEQGIMSRRSAEDAVKRGKILINGIKAETGQKIVPEIDEVTVGGVLLPNNESIEKVYIMLNKPAGVVTTMSDERGRPCVSDMIENIRVYPVGRLDMYSEGLLLLTNDGETANKIMRPKNKISKVYQLTVKKECSAETIKKLAEPIEIDGRMTAPAKINVTEMKNGKTKLKIEIFEGRNRQIRRMCDNFGLVILKLKRICVGKLSIGTLKPGQWRSLTANEIKYLREL